MKIENKDKMKKLILFFIVCILCQSCFSTRTSAGDYRVQKKVDKEASYNYSKAKQVYLFWGLLPLGRARAAVPPHGNCEIRTGFGFVDFLVGLLTGGVVTMQTIKVKAPKVSDSAVPENEAQASVPGTSGSVLCIVTEP